MEYLAETGDHFFDSGIITYFQKENEESDEGLEKDGIVFEDFRGEVFDVKEQRAKEQSSLFSWSSWLSSKNKSMNESSVLSKSSMSGVTRNKMSVLAHRVSKQCRNGDLFSGYADSITG